MTIFKRIDKWFADALKESAKLRSNKVAIELKASQLEILNEELRILLEVEKSRLPLHEIILMKKEASKKLHKDIKQLCDMWA